MTVQDGRIAGKEIYLPYYYLNHPIFLNANLSSYLPAT